MLILAQIDIWILDSWPDSLASMCVVPVVAPRSVNLCLMALKTIVVYILLEIHVCKGLLGNWDHTSFGLFLRSVWSS